MDKLRISEELARLDTIAGEFYVLAQTPLSYPSRQSFHTYSQGLTQAAAAIREEMFTKSEPQLCENCGHTT